MMSASGEGTSKQMGQKVFLIRVDRCFGSEKRASSNLMVENRKISITVLQYNILFWVSIQSMYSFFFLKPGVATLAEGQNSEVSTKAIRLLPLPGHARSRGETRVGGHVR